MPETVAVAVHLQDVDVMGEPVQQGSSQAFRAEDLGPLIEGQVGGDQDGAPLVALAEDLEEEFCAGGGEGHEALFIDDQQAEAGQLPLQVEQPFLVPGLHQLVDQGGCGGEAHRHSPLAGGQAKAPGPRGSCPVPLLPTAMTFSRRWMYSQRANSITSCLFTEGMAVKVEGVQALDGGEAGRRGSGAAPCAGGGR